MNGRPEASTGSLLERFDRPGPRYTSYPTAVEFSDAIGPDDYAARLRSLGASGAPAALYVHLPFCQERCTYCACNVVATRRHDRVSTRYLDHVAAEAALVAHAAGTRLPLSQVHFGGGTPTYHTPDELEGLVATLREHFDWRPDAEAAIEVDPRVTSDEHLRTLAACGFRRLSVGVQDLDPDVQHAIGREQPAAMTRATIDAARGFGFRSVNIDLVYGLPRQTPASFHATLDAVLELAPDRLAVYSFAWLPSAFHHQGAIDAADLPTGGEKVALLAIARERLAAAGYVDIGIDHFARPDDELAVAQRAHRLRRDFMGYTTRTATDYVGLGVSSIGFVAGAYVQNHKRLAHYLDTVAAGTLATHRGVALTADDDRRAYVIGELLCNFEVSKPAFQARFGDDFDAYFLDDLPRLAPLVDERLLDNGAFALKVTEPGRFVARNAAMCFDSYRRHGTQGAFSRTL